MIYIVVYDQPVMDEPSVPIMDGAYTTLEGAEQHIQWLQESFPRLPSHAFEIVSMRLHGDIACLVAGDATKHEE